MSDRRLSEDLFKYLANHLLDGTFVCFTNSSLSGCGSSAGADPHGYVRCGAITVEGYRFDEFVRDALDIRRDLDSARASADDLRRGRVTLQEANRSLIRDHDAHLRRLHLNLQTAHDALLSSGAQVDVLKSTVQGLQADLQKVLDQRSSLEVENRRLASENRQLAGERNELTEALGNTKVPKPLLIESNGPNRVTIHPDGRIDIEGGLFVARGDVTMTGDIRCNAPA